MGYVVELTISVNSQSQIIPASMLILLLLNSRTTARLLQLMTSLHELADIPCRDSEQNRSDRFGSMRKPGKHMRKRILQMNLEHRV